MDSTGGDGNQFSSYIKKLDEKIKGAKEGKLAETAEESATPVEKKLDRSLIFSRLLARTP